MVCILCDQNSEFYFKDDREYFQCSVCELVFVSEKDLLNSAEEKQHYDTHENNIYDSNYRKFLRQIFTPVNNMISVNSNGLDYGCGDGPALYEMFKEAGHEMSKYDPFYDPNKAALEKEYDFIVSTEVFEHFHNPKEDIALLFNLLKKGGILGLMTRLNPGKETFENWYYKNDPTHVCFYNKKTFLKIAEKYNKKLEILGDQVIILS